MSIKGMSPEQAKKIREQKGIENTKLQKVRVEKKLSQKELSIVSGVLIRTIQCYEQRTRHIDNANLKTLCDLAISLNCKITDILEDETLLERYKIVK